MSMPPNVAEIRKLMRPLDIQDRLSTLLLAILDDNTDALNCSQRLVWAIRRISEQQSADSRFRISETLRDLADRLECPAVVAHTH